MGSTVIGVPGRDTISKKQIATFSLFSTIMHAKFAIISSLSVARLAVQYEVERNSKSSGGNLGEQYFEKHRFVLKKLETTVKRKIAQLRSQRDKLRENRKKMGVPTVAVIGYTNCGKTSLIKALTQQAKLEPKNALFATLDVTCHRATLPPSNIDVGSCLA